MSQMPYCPRSRFQSQLPPLRDIYRPLDQGEFRLLQVHGYDKFGILRCSLRHTPCNQGRITRYSAISYTWNQSERLWYGDYDASPKPVRIDGVAVLVPDKVANIICMALQVIPAVLHGQGRKLLTRSQHNKQLIWIDAICINQDDKNEKSHQVARMGLIFGGAIEVLSFLGSPTAETDDVLDQVNSHGGVNKPIRKMSLKSLLALWSLLHNDYWRRAWTFQEIAIARTITVFCGSRLASLETMLEVGRYTSETIDWKSFRGGLETLRAMRRLKLVVAGFWKNGEIDESPPQAYAMKGAHNSFIEVLRESRRHNG